MFARSCKRGINESRASAFISFHFSLFHFVALCTAVSIKVFFTFYVYLFCGLKIHGIKPID